MGLEVTQLTPSSKKEGEEIEGDFMELITIKVGRLKNNFLFSFEHDVVSRLGHKSGANSNPELQKIVKAAGDTIARYSIRRYQEHNMQILQENPVTKDSDEYKRIRKAKGLKIPIRTPLGLMNIYGLMPY